MGCPINSVLELESGLRNRRQKLVIVIFASANSDSRAVDVILRNFHEMDMLSGDVDFYLPGYGVGNYNSFQISNDMEDYLLRESAEKFPDFHSNEVERSGLFSRLFRNNKHSVSPCRIIDSPRLGQILFNVAEFTDFILEFTRRINGFHYLGGCQMVLIKPKRDGMPDYQEARVYDLDSVISSPSGPSLDRFLFSTFQIIKETNRPECELFHNSILGCLFGGVRTPQKVVDLILRKIDVLYDEATDENNTELRYERMMNDVILDINNCLNWDITTNDFYFISYSSHNTMQAEMLKVLLRHHNVHVWIAPDGIPQGREYPLVVPTALKMAKVFVLLLTPESARSHWVKTELAIALNQREHMQIKVVLSGGMSMDAIRNDDELHFLLERVQIKYEYSEIVNSVEVLDAFIRD